MNKLFKNRWHFPVNEAQDVILVNQEVTLALREYLNSGSYDVKSFESNRRSFTFKRNDCVVIVTEY